MFWCRRLLRGVLITAAAAAFAAPCEAASITIGDWYQFSFTDAGIPAAGCDPADQAGGFCFESSGTPTLPGGAPPWTFTAPANGVSLTVTDQFLSGDQFEVFDFGASLGATSAFLADVDCGDDPAVCVATPGMSLGRFQLAAGDHSLTITPLASLGGGTAALRLAEVPEASSLALLCIGIGALGAMKARQKGGPIQ